MSRVGSLCSIPLRWLLSSDLTHPPTQKQHKKEICGEERDIRERERQKDGCSTKSSNSTSKPHTQSPQRTSSQAQTLSSQQSQFPAFSPSRFLFIRSDQSHWQCPRRPTPISRVPSSSFHSILHNGLFQSFHLGFKEKTWM